MSLYTTMHKVASPFLYKSGLYLRSWRTRSLKEPFSFVVFYHRVVADNATGEDRYGVEKGISASQFERQMQFLLRHFTPLPASLIQTDSSSEIKFAVTLDDGYEDNYLIAAPILKRLGIPATFYVVSDFVGTDRLFWWEQVAELMRHCKNPQLDMRVVVPDLCRADEHANVFPLRNHIERDHACEQLCARIREGPHSNIASHVKRIAEYFDVPLREQGRHYGLMNWQQLRDLIGQGFEIGGHSATHCNVVGADESLLHRELIESANVIEAGIDAPVESFAYPYGLFESSSELVSGLLDRTNCKAAFTTVQGVVSAALPAYELPRMQLNRPYDFACAYNLQDSLNKKPAPVR